jgi:hypothetical protein
MVTDGTCALDACDITCRTCDGGTDKSCTACKTNAILTGGACVCRPKNFRLASGGCEACPLQCESCTGAHNTTCTACSTQYYLLSNFGCVNHCPTIYPPIVSLKQCTAPKDDDSATHFTFEFNRLDKTFADQRTKATLIVGPNAPAEAPTHVYRRGIWFSGS